MGRDEILYIYERVGHSLSLSLSSRTPDSNKPSPPDNGRFTRPASVLQCSGGPMLAWLVDDSIIRHPWGPGALAYVRSILLRATVGQR